MAHERYSIIGRLDSGGMAEVFKGRACSLDGLVEKIVAIKRILPSLTKNEQFVRMFLDEARLSMCLTHANIVQTFDVGKAEGSYFLVMEYVEGTNLKKLMDIANRADRKVPMGIAVFIAMEVAKALAHAHEKKGSDGSPLGIVHRDVSPPNILISLDGEVKLVDFGLAKARSHAEITDPGVVKGKFAYLCPEVVDSGTIDSRADIFSLGIVLWELLTGKRLFLGSTDLETINLVRRCRIPSLRDYASGVPEGLELVLRKALSKNPDKRYQTAQEFGSDLARQLFASGMSVTTYDLADMVKTLLADLTPQPETRALSFIDQLIMEELERFHSINSGAGSMSDPQCWNGSRPLTLSDFSDSPDALPVNLTSALSGVTKMPIAAATAPKKQGASKLAFPPKGPGSSSNIEVHPEKVASDGIGTATGTDANTDLSPGLGSDLGASQPAQPPQRPHSGSRPRSGSASGSSGISSSDRGNLKVWLVISIGLALALAAGTGFVWLSGMFWR